MKIILTGATGFIGKWFLTLAKPENEYIVLGIESNINQLEINNRYFDFIKTDYSIDDLTTYINGADALVHLAAKRFEPGAMMNEYLENISIASNVFEACAKSNVFNVVNLSSIGVYNTEEPIPWSEDTIANPMTYYGISKLCIEKVAHYYNSKFNLCIKSLRLAQVLGPGERKGFMLSVFLSKALKKETLQLYGMGKGARDYIYVKDVISAINSAISLPKIQGLFNIGSNKSISHRELAETINEVFDNKDNLEFLSDKIEDTTEYRMNSDKSIDELNYFPKFTLKTALEDMKKYYEEIL